MIAPVEQTLDCVYYNLIKKQVDQGSQTALYKGFAFQFNTAFVD